MRLCCFFCKVQINPAWNGFKCSAISVGVYHKYSWMGTFQAWGVFSPLEETVCWKMSLMSKPKCLRKPGCLTTYCWHIREFLVENCVVSCCLADVGELRDSVQVQASCVAWELWDPQAPWVLSYGVCNGEALSLPGFSVRWLTVISLAETLKRFKGFSFSV